MDDRRSRASTILAMLAIFCSTAASATVEVRAGDMVTITITSAECASIGTVTSVSGPVSGIISSDACRGVGASITLGPSPSNGVLSFVMNDPRFGSGPFRDEGAYPNYTVFLEDGFGDGDYNDNILSVVMRPDICNFFKNPPSDPLLADPVVQEAMKNLWRNSKPLEPNNRREQGAYIVERNGQTEIVPFLSNSSPDVCTATIAGAEIEAIRQSGATIKGFMHTHPNPRGSRLPSGGACKGITDPTARFGDGPSDADQTAAGDSPWPSYVIDKDHVHRLDPFYQKGNNIQKVDRNSSCVRG